ncbi:MAG: T9SS type A sorting domain-containing protein [Salinibacter sp.]|uniref:T9SS type A sorting domain-containing protein n=1 Tax=Salinibacter sp. TaxID=2065818 RepID=UPI0035D4AE7F
MSNATVVFPSSTSDAVGPTDASLAGGATPDSIAIFSPEGDCVGVTAWNDSSGVALPVAGQDALTQGGLAEGDSLHFRIYDASRDSVDHAVVEYEECSAVASSLQPLCQSSGTYRKDAVYMVEAIGSYTRTLRVRGSSGKSGGDAGWRFIGLPTASSAQAEDLRIGENPVDFNMSGGYMLYEWDDQASTSKDPAGAYRGLSPTDQLRPGHGYAIYLPDQSPYPVDPSTTISLAGNPNLREANPVTVDDLAQTARWHLLANPYPSGYDLSGLSDLASNGFQSTVQRYDTDAGTWVAESQSSAKVAGWEAFFVERTDYSGGQGATSLTFDPGGRTIGVPFGGSKSKDASPRRHASLGLALHVRGAAGDTLGRDHALRVVFDERATKHWDSFDASKLTPLDAEHALLPLLGTGRDGSRTEKAAESRPWPSGLQSIPLRLRTHGLEAELATIAVRQWSLPEGWSARIVDTDTRRTHALSADAASTFAVRTDSTRKHPRFELQIAPDGERFPIELSAFEATLKDEAVHLQWQVPTQKASEASFHVDRRIVTDTTGGAGSGSWTEVGVVNGQGEKTGQGRTLRFKDAALSYEAVRFEYRLRRVGPDGLASLSETVSVERSRIQQVNLHGSFPNPARQQATIRYALPRDQRVQLDVYDVLGRRVMRLVGGRKEAGRHQVALNASRLSSGTYFYRLSTGETTKTRRLTVVR